MLIPIRRDLHHDHCTGHAPSDWPHILPAGSAGLLMLGGLRVQTLLLTEAYEMKYIIY
jgi:hypothetical protein